MDRKEVETINSSKIRFGNLFIVKDGIGKVTNMTFGVIELKKDCFRKPKYIAYPGGFEIFVGSYEITRHDNGVPFLINAYRLDEEIGKQEITGHQFLELIKKKNSSIK